MNKSKYAPIKPALKYHGAKWRSAAWILSFIFAHDSYIEPFGGSASVMLQKPRSKLEIYNDLDKAVVNFFRVLRDKQTTAELIRLIKLTPYSYDEWVMSWQPIAAEPIEHARRFYIRSMMSINGPTTQWSNSFRRQKVYSRGKSGKSSMKPAAQSFAEADHLWDVADRMLGVTIESMDALDLIQRYDNPNAFFYVDPPYVLETRANQSAPAYEYDMLEDDDHQALADVLHNVKGMVLLSGYYSQLYDDLFQDWDRVEKHFRINGENKRVECLWLNPKLSALQSTLPLTLFQKEN